MAYTVGTIQATLPQVLAGRTLPSAQTAEYVRKAVLELTENYKFPALQTSGPNFTLPIGNAGPYPYNDFLSVADQNLEIEKIDSFFIYYNPPVFPLTATSGVNPGYPLRFSTIDAMEMEINILGIPIHWSRHEGQIYFGFAPNQKYVVYARYRKEHPFPNAGLITAPNDPILMPNSWQDIVEYSTGERAAFDIRLYDIAAKNHEILYGDTKFIRTNGIEGKPGLIFGRTSQEEQDQSTTHKMMRVMTRSCMAR